MSRYVIGIDPGVSTGFAIYDSHLDKFESINTITFWSAYLFLCDWDPVAHPLKAIVIEVPDTNRVWQPSKGNVGSVQRTAVNVGRVLRESELLARGLELLQIGKVVKVNPRGKTSQETFVKLTGWEGGKLNQHCRDAAMLCYRWRGRNVA